MKRRGFILIGLLAAAGCSTRGPHVRVAAPMQVETVGLHLIAEPRRGPESAPYTVLCNVALHFVNNTRLALEANGKIVFYFAELNESDRKAADSVTQGLVDARQYRPDFRKGKRRDPTQRRTGP